MSSAPLESIWIQREKMIEILKENGVENEICDIEVVLPKMQGDHFASTCANITVSFKEELPALKLFIKKQIENSELTAMLNEIGMYEKEAAFFNILVPDLKKFSELKQNYNGFLEDLFPKCYFASQDMILLQNLVEDGYFILDKTIPHSVDQARLVLDKLAKMHGTAFAYIKEMGLETFKKKYAFTWEKSIWEPAGEKFGGVWVQMVVHGAIKILEASPTEGSKKALDFLKQYDTEAFIKCSKDYDIENPSCGIVINHGDCWSSNLMFKGDPQSKQLEQCVIIDLQTIYLGSPVLDLQVYLLMSMETNVCYNNLKDLLKFYYEQLKFNVEMLGVELDFSLEELVEDFRKKCTSGFFFAFYNIFGYEMHKEMDEVDKIEGDVVNHMASTMNAVVTRNMATKGKQYSEEIVNAFNKFHDFSTGKV